jgi:hypothetical protein
MAHCFHGKPWICCRCNHRKQMIVMISNQTETGGWSTAVATSGVKIVDGLGGNSLETWAATWPDERTDFLYRYVQPLSIDKREDPASLARCLAFLKTHPRWALSRQDHHAWGVA